MIAKSNRRPPTKDPVHDQVVTRSESSTPANSQAGPNIPQPPEFWCGLHDREWRRDIAERQEGTWREGLSRIATRINPLTQRLNGQDSQKSDPDGESERGTPAAELQHRGQSDTGENAASRNTRLLDREHQIAVAGWRIALQDVAACRRRRTVAQPDEQAARAPAASVGQARRTTPMPPRRDHLQRADGARPPDERVAGQ
jgi:hypothetical protein